MTVDIGSTEQQSRRRRRGVRPSTPAPRYRLVVLATSVGDVVSSAGGRLADRALAGWDIDVLVAQSGFDAADVRALQILGATVGDLAQAVEPSADLRPVAAVAVAAELFTADLRVRDRVLHAYDRNIAEVTVWGADIPAELSARFLGVEHVLSAAARTFKQYSLAALAAGHTRVADTEGFRTGARRGIGADLAPVGEYSAEDALRGRAGGRG
ncbi:hypothetical protein BH10ACT9_BH10ACT9_00550 [soil metagenome]